MKFQTVVAALVAGALAVEAAVTTEEATILNFALNLEYLEANYYNCGLKGAALTTADFDDDGPAAPVVTGCAAASKVTFAAADAAIEAHAEAILKDEIAHIKALRAALGTQAAVSPALNLSEATFQAVFSAANENLVVDVYGSPLAFALGAFIFEDVGVTAYQGAAGGLETAAILSAASKIMGTEAYHAGAIRRFIIKNGAEEVVEGVEASGGGVIPVVDAVDAITLIDAANAITDARASLSAPEGGGASRRLQPGQTETGASQYAATDGDGLTYGRTTEQVIAVVTLGGAEGAGGFFPEGLSLEEGTAAPTPAPTPKPTKQTSGASALSLAWPAAIGGICVAAAQLFL